MAGKTPVLASVLAVFMYCSTTIFCSTTNERANGICRERERQALLKFKQGLNTSTKILSTWVGDDCCNWEGVGCDNKTGHVVKLILNNFFAYGSRADTISGEINPSLLELVHLHHLDLSSGRYGSKPIPKFFGSFKKLAYLDLSDTDFVGIVPHQLGNLSNLQFLDLSSRWFSSKLQVDNFHWLSHLSSLQYLDLSYVNISMATDWLKSINLLPSLSVLRLRGCGIRELLPLSYTNFTSLTQLDLSQNSITSELPDWLLDVGNLVHLNISDNNMDGEISGFLQSLSRCGSENLVKNGRHSSIRELDLGYNNFSGTVPESLGQLSNLVYLRMSNNSLDGDLSEAHFVNLRSLKSLMMSSNSFVLNVSSDWVPPFQLKDIGLGSCKLGPRFPQWLRFQKGYERLDLSNAQVSDEIPNWFWNLSSEVSYLNLSENEMRGILPTSMRFSSSAVIDFSSNKFMGPLPNNISGAYVLDLSNNLFSGKMISNYSGILFIDISNNNLNGSIPTSICGAERLRGINLSKNQFTGEIPVCFENITSLVVLDLSHNNLHGVIPKMSSCPNLQWLQLSDNYLSGEIHSLFRSLDRLEVVDLSENRLYGHIPILVELGISQLRILKLRSNMFDGKIPRQLSLIHPRLQILDLAFNRLSGTIPSSFERFYAMRVTQNMSAIIQNKLFTLDAYGEKEMRTNVQKMVVVVKGRGLEYTTTLSLVNAIDLSCNYFSGEIPEELVYLHELKSLNLSGNHLKGKIPKEIGSLKQLESLDLSRNLLSGEIPSSISSLTFLSSLNLSYNNLSGQIPPGYQLQILPDLPYIYIGNHDLCGPPLPKMCNAEQVPQTSETLTGEDEEDKTGQLWFYGSMTLGFVIGFWSFCGILLFNNSWRIGYYRFFTNLIDHLNGLFVYVVVKMVKK